MSSWACNDGMSDDELSPTTVVINSPSPPPELPERVESKPKGILIFNPPIEEDYPIEPIRPPVLRRTRLPTPDPIIAECSLSPSPTPSPIKNDQFYTDGCGDRPYTQDTRSRARSQSPPVASVPADSNDCINYAKHDNEYYKEPRIIVNYTGNIGSVPARQYSMSDYISSKDVFSHISLGGKLPRELMKILNTNIFNKVSESFIGNDCDYQEFKNNICIQEGTSASYMTNFVASPYKGTMFRTRNYDIILGECTKMFLKYNDQVIY